MQFRIAMTVLATTGAVLAGAGTARAGTLTSTVESPQGVVWTGLCPETIMEKDVDSLTPICRDLGYRSDTATFQAVTGLGGTKLTDTAQDGRIVNVSEITADGRWQRTNFMPDGSSVVTNCAIAGNEVPYSGCTRTVQAAGGSLASTTAAKAHAAKKHAASKRHARR
jgi:hypothetical protein